MRRRFIRMGGTSAEPELCSAFERRKAKRHLIVPARLVGRREMRIGGAGIRHREEPRHADLQALLPETRIVDRRCERLLKRPVGSETMEAGDARAITLELRNERRHAGRKFFGWQVACPRARALCQIGKAKAVIEQRAIMRRLQPLDAQRLPGGLAERRAREAGPETVAAPCKIMAVRNREERRVDADEYDIEPVGKQIGQRCFAAKVAGRRCRDSREWHSVVAGGYE